MVPPRYHCQSNPCPRPRRKALVDGESTLSLRKNNNKHWTRVEEGREVDLFKLTQFPTSVSGAEPAISRRDTQEREKRRTRQHPAPSFILRCCAPPPTYQPGFGRMPLVDGGGKKRDEVSRCRGAWQEPGPSQVPLLVVANQQAIAR